MAFTYKGLTVELGADTSKFSNAIKSINKDTAQLGRELREVTNQLKLDPKNANLLAQKQKILNEQYKVTEERLKTLKSVQDLYASGMDAAGEKIPDDEIRKFNEDLAVTESKLKTQKAELKAVTEEFAKYSGALGKATAGLEDFSKKTGEVAQKTRNMSLVASAALGLIVKSAIDYESAFAGVRKTVDMTEEEFTKLSDSIRQMSKELPFSAVEIAKVVEIAGQLGVHNDGLMEFTRNMLYMGESTSMSAEESANNFARFMNIMDSNQKIVGNLGSAVVELGNNYATTETEIMDMALRLAGAGKQAKLTEAQVLGLAAGLSSLGLKAESGGSSFSRVIQSMSSSASYGVDAMQKYADVAGTTAQEFYDQWKSKPIEAINMFIAGLGRLNEEDANTIAILNDLGLGSIRLTDTLLRSANASDLLAEAQKSSQDAFLRGRALEEEAAKRNETLAAKLEIVKNKLVDQAITLGTKLMPHIENFAEWIGKVADGFGNMNPGMQRAILLMLGATAAISPFAKGLSLITGGLGKAVGAVSTFATAIKGGSTVVGALTATMGPLGVAIGAVAVAGAVLGGIYLLVNSSAKKADEETKKLTDSIEKQSQKMKELDESQQVKLTSDMASIVIAERYKNELDKLIDAEGNIIGNKERVNWLVSELNSIYPNTISYVNDEKIAMDGLNESIEQQLLLKKAQIFLDSMEEKYTEAVLQRSAATQDLIDLQGKLNEAQERLNNAEYGTADYLIAILEVDELTKKVNEAGEAVNKMNEITAEYEGLSTAIMVGDLETINQLIEGNRVIMQASSDAITNGTISAKENYDKALVDFENYKQAVEEGHVKMDEEEYARREEAVTKAKELWDSQELFNQEFQDRMKDTTLSRVDETVDETEKKTAGMIGSIETLIRGYSPSEIVIPVRYEVQNSIPGSNPQLHNNGADFIPYDGYHAILHRGERVLTAYENAKLNSGGFIGKLPSNNVVNSKTISVSNQVAITVAGEMSESKMKRLADILVEEVNEQLGRSLD